MWVCKKHGQNCNSYVQGIVEALNKSPIHSKDVSRLVEWEQEIEK